MHIDPRRAILCIQRRLPAACMALLAAALLTVIRIDVSSARASPTYSVTLRWSQPRKNIDGSALTDLAGYHVRWGRDPKNLSNTMDLAFAGYSWITLTDLSVGLWYFSIRSYNSRGVESPAVVVSRPIGYAPK